MGLTNQQILELGDILESDSGTIDFEALIETEVLQDMGLTSE